jgi:hypothetical protein
MALAAYGTEGTAGGSFYDPPRSGAPADTA